MSLTEKFSLTQYPYPSQRQIVLGNQRAVATSQPLATLAGMEMFWAGGNAVDAALAMAIALTIVEPTSNGIGGDAFALIWDGKLHGLNASGCSPQNLTLATLAGRNRLPKWGWLPVTVPGAVSAWRTLGERWGKLPFEQLFAPAIRYAESGFPVSPVTAAAWQRMEKIYLPLQGREFQAFQEVFFPGNRSPKVGEIWRSQAHAETLKAIASTGGESFYQGKLAAQIAQFAADTGGLLTTADLAQHQSIWVEPIAINYRGLTVWELPPNTQGIATLMALNILENYDLSQYPRDSAESYHLQIEAMKLAFADVHRYVADARFMDRSTVELLDRNYGRSRQQSIGDTAIPLAQPGLSPGGTVYLTAADSDLMVSFIQSNYMGFGSGILVPGTGIALQNRAVGFSLEAGHPNQLAPGKRPFHTIIPGFLTEGDRPLGAFGVMGGAMQPQGHLQVIVNLADYHLNPQAALDAPRWQFMEGNQIWLEPTVAPGIIQGLASRGHQIQISSPTEFGKGQIILRHNGALIAASEPRADGLALAQ